MKTINCIAKMSAITKPWYQLKCSKNELQLLGTLNGGQSFRWEKRPDKSWVGVFANKLWILRQDEHCLSYQVYEPNLAKEKLMTSENEELHYNSLLQNYFRLDVPIKDHYAQWADKDPYFKTAAEQFYGVRILNQDLVENIFSFICSSNNNIKRISSMVNKLGRLFGTKIVELDDNTYYTFPEVETLAEPGVESILRDNGFGYRAKYISTSARAIMDNGGSKWLDILKQMNYAEAKKSLMTLQGIGAKVADCICLMSLNHLQAIPVDTHIYQIAKSLYLPHLGSQKTVTEKVYTEIGDHFRELYGPLAGWAHTVLFCADLKKFSQLNDGKVISAVKRAHKRKLSK